MTGKVKYPARHGRPRRPRDDRPFDWLTATGLVVNLVRLAAEVGRAFG